MTIYDISQEVFSCRVYPGDPAPERRMLSRIDEGAVCNLSAFSMCAHNGTHIDAPLHFLDDGKAVDQIDLRATVGMAYVWEHSGSILYEDAKRILETARAEDPQAAKRILIKGKATLTEEAAELFAASGILLFGNESQTVGPEDSPMQVHLTLLSREVILLEGIVLEKVPEGGYLLCAAPLNLSGADGSPCRATLIKL